MYPESLFFIGKYLAPLWLGDWRFFRMETGSIDGYKTSPKFTPFGGWVQGAGSIFYSIPLLARLLVLEC